MNSLEDILLNTNIYILAKDKKAKYIYCNEKYAELLNLDSPAQIIGKTDYNFFPKEIASICFMGDKQVLNGSTLWNYLETIKVISSLDILINKSPIIKTKGVAGVVASFIEQTAYPCKTNELMYYCEKKKRYYFQINNQKEYFTELEYTIFKQLFLGLSCKQIASRLSLSCRTIESYVSRIKIKLQCVHKNRIVETAIRYGITHPVGMKIKNG